MRPRLLHLGYLKVAREAEHVQAGFNEAEAFTPRIRRPAPCAGTCVPRFNEAEAFTPRIHARIQEAGPRSENASMRPRLLHLGYRADTDHYATAVYASMRPRLLHLGYAVAHSHIALYLFASMRPRLLHLGYVRRVAGWLFPCSSFNEAEAFTPRIHAWGQERISMDIMLQ